MNIIHGVNRLLLPRFLSGTVRRMADVMPVVVVTGARQTGKSTLVRDLLPGRRSYLTLDDLDVRAQAERAPADLLARGRHLVLDEVQRVPELLLAVKQAVDTDRYPGRFILTGSANLLLMRSVTESLAGRAAYVTLWPLGQSELAGRGRPGPWSDLLDEPVARWPEMLAARTEEPRSWREAVRAGGYPVPAIDLVDPGDRAIWLDGYVRTYLERDLRDLASIENLVDFRRLMEASCHRLGRMLNQTELGRDLQLSQATVHRWLNLLEASHQFVRLPAWTPNRTSRLMRTPKAYWCDTALALRLAGRDEPDGASLETLVLVDLLAWRDAAVGTRPGVFYWRTRGGREVDFVIESGDRLLAVEVTTTERPTAAKALGLRSFRDEYGKRVTGGLLLHGGTSTEWLGDGILAAPWWCIA
jgi:predicted AAA+ superfamily ATPase